jgi:hypothetical protein
MRQKIIFKSIEYQKQFDKKGFVTFPLLNKSALSRLHHLYEEINGKINKSNPQKYSSAQDVNLQTAQETSNKILDIVLPPLQNHVENIDALAAAYLTKPSNQSKKDAIEWHQALSLVDETHFDAAMAWIGLEEKVEDNWLYYLVPFSHRFNDFVRVAPKYSLYFEKYMFLMNRLAVKTPLKKGEVLIFNNRLLNRSPENKGSKESKAIQIALKPNKAKWQYYFRESKRDEVNIYQVDPDFYFNLWTNNTIQNKYEKQSQNFNNKSASLKDFFKLIYYKYR